MNKLGYARVSTRDQNLDLQINALNKAGCTKIFEDKGISGTASARPGLESLLCELQPGDTLVIWKLDRLGRSIRHLLDTVCDLKDRNIAFHSLNDAIDTSNATGRLLFHVMAAFAEFERNLISERTIAGIEAARERGVLIGRPRLLSPDEIERARSLINSGEASLPDTAKSFGVERTTLWRALKEDYG